MAVQKKKLKEAKSKLGNGKLNDEGMRKEYKQKVIKELGVVQTYKMRR